MIDEKYIQNMNEFPTVLVGNAATDFCKYYDGPIVTVSNDRELQEALGYYSSISNLGRPLVIGDISFISGSNTILLKFLEETKLDVVLLSRFDRLDQVIISRVKKIEKYNREKTDCKFMSPESAMSYIDQLPQDTSFFNKVRTQSLYCPTLMKMDKKFKSSAVKRKYLKMLGGNLDE